MAEPSIVVVFDESISYRICGAISGFCERDSQVQFEMMPRGKKDPEWLNGFFPDNPPHIVIAKDSLLRPQAQTLAWLKGGLTIVIVDRRLGNLPLEHLAAILLRWWPTIAATIKGTPTQGAFLVPSRFTKRARLPKWKFNPRKRRIYKTSNLQKAPPKKRKKTLGVDKRQTRLEV